MLNFIKSGLLQNFKWIMCLTFFAIVIELSVHFFLFSLTAATEFRYQNSYLLYFLPFAGLIIGYIYLVYGKTSEGGNNLIIDAFYKAQTKIPIISTPLVYFGTIATHLFGGSAGREGAGIQIAGGYVDYFTRFFKYSENERHLLLKIAVGGGFSAVFGTPFTGIFFAFEFFNIGKPNFKGALSIIYVCLLIDVIATFLGLEHTAYQVDLFPKFEGLFLIYLILAGVLFGLTARLFSWSIFKSTELFRNKIAFLPYRLFIGGCFIVALSLILNTKIYLGIGIPTILDAFVYQQSFEVFILKILFTIITLGSGFKGGEVTPLFFIGATLGSFLSIFIPLPTALLAALGFVCVFSGAANTPIACFILAIELFGFEIIPYALISCCVAYLSSGYSSIFRKQKITNFKMFSKSNVIGKRISEL